MRSRTGLAAAGAVMALLALGCGTPDAGKPPPQSKVAAKPTAAPPGQPGEAPLTVAFLGLSADREHIRYRIHVNTDKPLEQADVGLTYFAADGNQERATVVWRNVVKSKRQPIEKGKAYEGETPVGRGATGVTCKILHVVYKDMTSWAPTK